MDSESFHYVLTTKRKDRCKSIPARYVLAFLIFWGLFVIYLLRANLSVAMVAMVNGSALAKDGKHGHVPSCIHSDETSESNDTVKYKFEIDGEFEWDTYTQSIILSAFYYGYVATQLPGGWIAERWGGKWPFGVGTFLTSVFTVLTPLAARASVPFIVLVRIAKGLGEGLTYPAMYALFSRWTPVKERSLLIAIASVGANLGTILGMPATASLCEHGFDNGWPSAFYICGVLGCIWFIPWAIIVASRPTRHSAITDTELLYLKNALGPLKKRPPTPWKKILLSGPVWAVTLARFASYWGLYTLLTELPNYLRNEMGYNMDQNGAVNAIVYTAQSIGMIAGGYLSDLLRTRTSIPLNINRKIFESIGCFGPAACLLGIPFVGCNRTAVSILLTFAQGFYGFNAGGSIPAMVDLAPDLAGTVSGLVLTIASCAGFMAPLLAGKLVQRGLGIQDWNMVFYIAAGVYIAGGLAFICFGSAEIQPWGKPVDVPSTPKVDRRLFITSPSASFSHTPILANDGQVEPRLRFYTVAALPSRTASVDSDNTTAENFTQSEECYVEHQK